MRHVIVAVAILAIPLPAAAQALRGVWKPVEITLSGGSASSPTGDIPGLIIITDDHYSVTLDGVASAGSYQVTDVALVLMPVIVTPAGAVAGTQALPLRLIADTLWLTTNQWYGSGVEGKLRFVRLSGPPVVAAKGGKIPKPAEPAADNASMILGTWTLNLEKSEFTPGPPPKSQQVTFERTATGVRYSTTTVDAAGKSTQEGWSGIEDGRDFPVSGARDYDVQSIRISGKLRAEIITKRGGRIAMGGERVVSSNGKTMTITLSGTSAGGQIVKETRVFDRQN